MPDRDPQLRASRSSARGRTHLLKPLLLLGMVALCGAPLQAALSVTVTLTPSTIRFPDASPTTTPVVAATAAVQVAVVVAGATKNETWSVTSLANGDLVNGPWSIASANVTWTALKSGGGCGSCVCMAGAASKTVPQSVLVGQGNTNANGIMCTQSYNLANSWSYAPGAYTQSLTITTSSP